MRIDQRDKNSKNAICGGASVLATDLDGTLIPLPDEPRNRADLETLARLIAEHKVTLVYVTGRDLQLAQAAIKTHRLPPPDWLVGDVGTSIFARDSTGSFAEIEAYHQHLQCTVAEKPSHALYEDLQTISALRPQESTKQGPFKVSFYTDAERLEAVVAHVVDLLESNAAPWSIVHSIDPFNGDGLIDLLPRGVSKSYALAWWAKYVGISDETLVFAGDSGNDFAVLTSGYRVIVVGNADRALAARVYRHHRQQGWTNRLYLAGRPATSAVLDGCQWFGLIAAETQPPVRLGATPLSIHQTHFCVWAPGRKTVDVEVLEQETTRLQPLIARADGYFSGTVAQVGPGQKYRYVLDGRRAYPDPASRFQPDGVHGASQVTDPNAFPWTDQAWKGVAERDLTVHKLDVGTFTGPGTLQAAIARIAELVELDFTAVELMPMTQSSGRWSRSYDGTSLFAALNTCGHPDDLKAFVDACHTHGLGVIADFIWIHVGSEGTHLTEFGPYLATTGERVCALPFDFEGPGAQQVRRFVVDSALYWLDEYHLDGLRLQAEHGMQDSDDPAFLAELRRAVSSLATSTQRQIHLFTATLSRHL